MKTFQLLGFLVGSVSAFAPSLINKTNNGVVVNTKLAMSDLAPASSGVGTEPELPADPAVANMAAIIAAESNEPYAGEGPTLTPNTYVEPENEALALNKQRVPTPNHFAERQTKATTLTEIRAQQLQHGMHTSSNGIDYTRNVRRW